MLCVFVSCVQRVVCGRQCGGYIVLGVHVDVHGEWVMLWVATTYSVLSILRMAETIWFMSSAGSV